MFSDTMHTAVNRLFYNPGPVFKVASIRVVQNIHVQPQNYNQSLFEFSLCPWPAVVRPNSSGLCTVSPRFLQRFCPAWISLNIYRLLLCSDFHVQTVLAGGGGRGCK